MSDSSFTEKSIAFEKSIDFDYKKVNGIFYTDLTLARDMVNFLNLPKNYSIIDPCCGTGAFLYILKELEYNNVVGCDFDKDTVDECKKISLCKEVHCFDTINNSGSVLLDNIKHDRFDCVIGNPPYGNYRLDKRKFSDLNFVNIINDSGANLFIGAILRSFEIVKDNGIISIIIPKNFLHISKYEKLRKSILQNKTIISIVELGIHFKNVRGEQIILTMKNKISGDNKILFYNYDKNRQNFTFLSQVAQSYYKNEIIVFTKNEEIPIYEKLNNNYSKLENYCYDRIHRGHNNTCNSVKGKEIRKFGFKNISLPKDGNQIFIQNIFAAEAGLTATYAGNLLPEETVTVVTLKNKSDCKYILGLLLSRVCNYFLIRFKFNNSRLTIHTDAKYLNLIPIKYDYKNYNELIDIVEKLEKADYMKKEWFALNEKLNKLVYKIYKLEDSEVNYIESEMRNISAKKWYG